MFTPHEIAEMRARHDRGEAPNTIAQSYGVTVRRIARLLDRPRKNPVAIELLRSSGAVQPPAEVLFERDIRLSQPLTLTQLLLGDPPPGRAARMAELNRRRVERLREARRQRNQESV